MDELLLQLTMFYLLTSVVWAIYFLPEDGLAFFNPIRNHKEWGCNNWAWVIFGTMVAHIVFAPWAIVYWAYKICTIWKR